jgi:hypothetical protein
VKRDNVRFIKKNSEKGIKKIIIKNITITDKITEKKCSTLEI